MGRFNNISHIVLDLAYILSQDITIQKLLRNDKPTAATDGFAASLSAEEMINKHYIELYPTITNDIQYPNTFITIIVQDVDTSNDVNVTASFAIYVASTYQTWLLEDNSERVLVIADRIDELLNNKKISAAGTININSVNFLSLAENRPSYCISGSIADQMNSISDETNW